MKNRHLLTASLLGASALTFAAPAQAQRVDNIVVFGDSYADDGNAFQLAGINPVTTQIYTTGRFSGGTNYIDTLADILGATTENFAIGGAKTDNTNTSGPLPGFQFEVQAFLAGGLVPAFPSGDGLFDENDLLAVSIGGNDARQYQQLGGTLVGAPAAATVAAGNATFGLDALVDAGAQNISFLAGDTGRLPEIALDPTGAAIRSSFSSTFNTAMQSTLAGYAADGAIVHYLDLNLVLDNVSANPAAYGITNGIACPTFPGVRPAAGQRGLPAQCRRLPVLRRRSSPDLRRFQDRRAICRGAADRAAGAASAERPRPRRGAPVWQHPDRPHGHEQPARRRYL